MKINWKAIELTCKCADLVAFDRLIAGREQGRAGRIRSDYENCTKAVANGLKAISDAFTRGGF
jgi:hypothetical protein